MSTASLLEGLLGGLGLIDAPQEAETVEGKMRTYPRYFVDGKAVTTPLPSIASHLEIREPGGRLTLVFKDGTSEQSPFAMINEKNLDRFLIPAGKFAEVDTPPNFAAAPATTSVYPRYFVQTVDGPQMYPPNASHLEIHKPGGRAFMVFKDGVSKESPFSFLNEKALVQMIEDGKIEEVSKSPIGGVPTSTQTYPRYFVGGSVGGLIDGASHIEIREAGGPQIGIWLDGREENLSETYGKNYDEAQLVRMSTKGLFKEVSERPVVASAVPLVAEAACAVEPAKSGPVYPRRWKRDGVPYVIEVREPGGRSFNIYPGGHEEVGIAVEAQIGTKGSFLPDWKETFDHHVKELPIAKPVLACTCECDAQETSDEPGEDATLRRKYDAECSKRKKLGVTNARLNNEVGKARREAYDEKERANALERKLDESRKQTDVLHQKLGAAQEEIRKYASAGACRETVSYLSGLLNVALDARAVKAAVFKLYAAVGAERDGRTRAGDRAGADRLQAILVGE